MNELATSATSNDQAVAIHNVAFIVSCTLGKASVRERDNFTIIVHTDWFERFIEALDAVATDTRVMLLKLYYDNEETEALNSRIHSFRIFLSRNKLVSDDIRRAYLNFIRFLGQVLRARSTKKLLSIREKVEAAAPLPARKWLLEIIDAQTK